MGPCGQTSQNWWVAQEFVAFTFFPTFLWVTRSSCTLLCTPRTLLCYRLCLFIHSSLTIFVQMEINPACASMWGEFFFYIKVFGTVCRHWFWALWADPFVHNSSVFSLDAAWVWNILQAAHSPDIIQYLILGQMQHCWVSSGARAGCLQFIVGLDIIWAHLRAALVRIWMFHPLPWSGRNSSAAII